MKLTAGCGQYAVSMRLLDRQELRIDETLVARICLQMLDRHVTWPFRPRGAPGDQLSTLGRKRKEKW
jgi:hypothetical protein